MLFMNAVDHTLDGCPSHAANHSPNSALAIPARAAVWLVVAFLVLFSGRTVGQVVISEIMYHPVEAPEFDADGFPVLDLSSDVHEFIELHNSGSEPVSLEGWRITGGIRFSFPEGAVIQAGAYRVVAKDPARLAAIQEYELEEAELFGPFEGQLSNSGETIRLRNGQNEMVDALRYSDSFPWAIGADGFGASKRWTGLDPLDYQYRGRSLERVSFTHSANDPANWLASPLPGNPSPGRPNAVQREVPQPVVISISVYQNSNEQPVIRQNQAVRIEAVFSAPNDLSNVQIEYYVVDLNNANVPRSAIPMQQTGDPDGAKFTALLPGFSDRQVIRYRFLADRGEGRIPVSPRPDDPFEWHAFFVAPLRTGQAPAYDLFVSNASLSRLASNISQSPRRVTTPDPPGHPRESWNATEPAIFVHDNVVYDIHMRHRGSRWNRQVGRNSFKFHFPRYAQFQDHSSWLVADKGNDTVAGHGLFREAGIPTSITRRVDLYLNNNSRLSRLEMEVNDDTMLERYHREQALLNPGMEIPPLGEIYKSKGLDSQEGPYGRGDGSLLRTRSIWSPLDRYTWTYNLKNNDWKGHTPFIEMIEGMWQARNGRTTGLGAQEIGQLRDYFLEHWDVDKMLTYIVLINWMAPWDDIFHNYFVWRHSDGKWCLLPWDFDGLFNSGNSSFSLFAGEVGDRSNNFRGANFFKDSFIKAFREELKERFFLLNNTLLDPDNLSALGYGMFRNFAVARQRSVNTQLGFGEFHRPERPVHLSPSDGQALTPPGVLRSSSYAHSSPLPPAHVSTTWSIRAADGSHSAPVYKVTSSEHLTSLPIPFEALEFGRTYFWQAIYHDAQGHPSVPSLETSFAFGQGSSLARLINIDAETLWRYNQTGANLPISWRQPGYNDSAWPSGAALLAREDAPLAEPIRTQLQLGPIAYYFRTRFNFPGPAQDVSLRLRHIIDDGAVFYLNGAEVLRVDMPPGTITSTTLATRTVADAVYSDWIEIPSGSLVSGENVMAVQVHQSNQNSSDIVFGMLLEAEMAFQSGDIVINELMAINRSSVENEGSFPDWVELYNGGTASADLSGWTLSDNMLVPDRFVFPPNTVIPAKGYLVVWCDDNFDAPGLRAGFALSGSGESLALFQPGPGGYQVVDHVSFGVQLADASLGRIPNGTGEWRLNIPTPGDANQVQALGSPSSLRINEWMASPASGEDWFEIYNPDPLPVEIGGFFLTDRLTEPERSQILPLSFIEGTGYAVFIADGRPDRGGNHVDFSLSAAGEAIGLYNSNGLPIDTIIFGQQTTGVSEGRLPDGAPQLVFFEETVSPGEANHLPITDVVINEALSHSDPPLEDAIELRNVTDQAVDISGWFLSDSARNFQKFRVPSGTVIPPGGYHVFYEYQFNPEPGTPGSFALSSSRGDRVFLSAGDPDGNLTGYRSGVEFGPSENGISFGRYVTSVGVDFPPMSRRTFGADSPASVEAFRMGTGLPNAYPLVGPVVINELMYHPPAFQVGEETIDNTRDEFVELHNITGEPVPFYHPEYPENTWRIEDGIRFQFPPGIVLPPQGCLLVVRFDPVNEPEQLEVFRNVYGLNSGTIIVGPYEGRLSNSGERIALLKPDTPQLPAGPQPGLVPYVLVDQVEYQDRDPWPREADGRGASLQRRNPAEYGNDPVNWFAAAPSPGQSNASLRITSAGLAGTQGFRLLFHGESGTSYRVQYRDSLGSGAWVDLEQVSPSPEPGMIEVTDPLQSGIESRYYRVIQMEQ
jgi:hypothetical protein